MPQSLRCEQQKQTGYPTADQPKDAAGISLSFLNVLLQTSHMRFSKLRIGTRKLIRLLFKPRSQIGFFRYPRKLILSRGWNVYDLLPLIHLRNHGIKHLK